jgi:hypothetical protein
MKFNRHKQLSLKKFLSNQWIWILLGGGLLFLSFRIVVPTNVMLNDFSIKRLRSTDSFSLQKGDLLVRPNWPYLPGCFAVKSGRRYGHVAIVVEGASGNSIDEVLQKAVVVEALFFDQQTRSFLFDREKQVRKTSASISFGPKFKGIRYRLRTNLTNEQTKAMAIFLEKQLDAHYNILSLKGPKQNNPMNRDNWHCATLAWKAYELAGIDIDGNGGLLLYPSDILGCKAFEGQGGCVLF